MTAISNGGSLLWGCEPKHENPVCKFYVPPPGRRNAEVDFQEFVCKSFNQKFDDYEEWYQWTCKYPNLFWEAVLKYTGITLSHNYSNVLDLSLAINEIPKWFAGARLNYAENCLFRGQDGKPAFIQAESGTKFRYYDYGTLRKDVATVSTALRKLGIKPGDKVCGFLPNIYETSVAMLATATVGAVWASASTDFGPTGVLDRFSQIEPKVLFATNFTCYKQKQHSLVEKVEAIMTQLTSLEHVIMIPFNDELSNLNSFSQQSKFLLWQQLRDIAGSHPVLSFEQVPFDHPLFILFSSGTTGAPKGMVHTVGGTLLKHVEEHIIQTNMGPSDTVMFYTTCGWMMWNWLMSVLYTGAAIVLFDESPLEPDPHVLLKICQNTRATIIGMGAKIWDEYARMNVDFKNQYDLSSLRLALSTGSPLKASTFAFINKFIHPEIVIGSISGGTDIVGCFVGATLNRPVVPGECQHFYLGMDMCSFNFDGKSIVDVQGELVCKTPFPSMPSRFINDPKGERYFKAYFDKYPGIWTHGDFCLVSGKTRGVIIFGRSDATLNRGGVRIGTAEIYNVVERIDGIDDSLVVGKKDVNDEDNEEVLLFVKLRHGTVLTSDLKKKIKTEIRAQMSPRHVPNEIYHVADIPYTNSGKKVELAVKNIIHNEAVKNLSSIRNPEALDHFVPFARQG